ncbi:MAG: hypothetical protein COA52_05400 [Hyphomicrobiales bacterium]|nr:MAG: hypothetical protein COA52_05400 [Hyphomicrobiales bacterium]
MPLNDSYDTLGLVRDSATSKTVRLAYAKKLKTIRPEDDPEGFMVLRTAYETVRREIQWQEQDLARNATKTDVDSQSESTKSQQTPKPDSDIDLGRAAHFNQELKAWLPADALGHLVEHIVRWVVEENASQPKQFFATLNEHAAFTDTDNTQKLTRKLSDYFINWVANAADIFDDYGALADVSNIKKPKWLTDEAIIAFYEYFQWFPQDAQESWEARQINALAALFEPVLLAHNVISEPLQRIDADELEALEITQQNQDDFGSYFNRQTRKWVDQSPVGCAVQDAQALVDRDSGAGILGAWEEIIEREALQPIDEFQSLSQRLLELICHETGFGNREQPKTPIPNWLTGPVLRRLDNQFGWSSQNVAHHWQRSQSNWFSLLFAPYKSASKSVDLFHPNIHVNIKSYAFLGYQPMPIWLKATTLFFMYIAYRIALPIVIAASHG